ncbi:hypothetical protein [Pseudonocardia sp. WMMC193]|uniref:hypothetical protein n=1 Tax=Pseudonocardia sp. WMMC193 TaxID=2911965 RepID=UPI001F25B720|nr:hypothetical protein [Pseudonocardia sp. WMMC193]MCF7550959.1 hypothetical protein [Pseudonocardia sp. WMMC193]
MTVTPGFRAALISAYRHRRTRAAQANRAWRRLLAVPDQLDLLLPVPGQLDRMERRQMAAAAADRELLSALAASIPAIGDGIDKVVADRDTWRDRALAAEGREATDEAGDVDAAQPLKDAIGALAAKVSGLVPATPPVLEEVPAVVDAAPDAPTAPTAPDTEPAEAPTEPAPESPTAEPETSDTPAGIDPGPATTTEEPQA